MLLKKLLRTLRFYKAQFISMIIMITLGVGVFVGFNMEWYSIELNLNETLASSGFADFRLISETGFTDEECKKIAAIDGVEKAARFISVNAEVISEEKEKEVLALSVTTDDKVSGVYVTEGEKYDENSIDGIWLSDRFAEANGYKVGDNLTVEYKTLTISGTIKGLVKASEYLICVPDETQLMPDYNSYGFAYVSPAKYSAIIGTDFYTQINVSSSLPKKDFSEKVNEALSKTTMVIAKEDTLSYSEAMGESEEGKTMGSILPVLFLAIAALTMITTMHRITKNEKIQIGILKALGFKDRKIALHYSGFALLVGLIGSFFGIGLGYGLAYYIMNPNGAMGTYLDFINWKLGMPWFCILVVAIMDILLVFIGFLSVKKILSLSGAQALRPYVPKHVKKLALEKTPLWNKLSFGTKWNLRDIIRHKSRSLMTCFGVFGCVILVLGGLGMRNTLDSFVDLCYNKAINYQTVINISENADNDKAKSIAEIYNGDWAAKSAVELNDKAVNLEIYKTETDLVRFIGNDLEFVALKDEGVYLCNRLINEFSLNVGDEIEFSPFGTDKKYTVTVIGSLRSLSESIIMTKEFAEKTGIDYKINTVYTNTLSASVDKSEYIVNTQTKKAIIDSFDTFMELMNTMVFLLILLAIILGVIVLYNLGVMSYIERYREMATLKVVGFKDAKIGKLLIGQNLLITIIGIILGIPAGLGVLSYLITALASEYEMKLYVSVLSVVITTVLTLAVSFLVSLILARKNKRINMVEALKSGE